MLWEKPKVKVDRCRDRARSRSGNARIAIDQAIGGLPIQDALDVLEVLDRHVAAWRKVLRGLNSDG